VTVRSRAVALPRSIHFGSQLGSPLVLGCSAVSSAYIVLCRPLLWHHLKTTDLPGREISKSDAILRAASYPLVSFLLAFNASDLMFEQLLACILVPPSPAFPCSLLAYGCPWRSLKYKPICCLADNKTKMLTERLILVGCRWTSTSLFLIQCQICCGRS
jgi:hypothetical protein